MRSIVAALAVLLAPLGTIAGQHQAHRVVHVTVAPGVHLEVLDWGGQGPGLVFLAGFGNTGHIFDGFAPQFTRNHHVLAITRRGFGRSSKPRSGYDTKTLTSDILSVLDSLGMRRASFAAHSFGGSELSWLGAHHADRVDQLVYLDASYDYARLFADATWKHAFPVPQPPLPATPDLVRLRRWFALVLGPAVPDDEIRAMTNDGGSAVLADPLQRGVAALSLTRITPPVLVLWASPRLIADQYPYWRSLDAASRARVQTSFAAQQAIRSAHLAEFRREMPQAHFVMVAGARHYVFLSHPRQVTDAMNAFLRVPRPQPNER